jgi:hypothetical protein
MPDELLVEARKRAAANGTTMSEVITAAVREAFAHRSSRVSRRRHISLISDAPITNSGLRPGVNLDDSASLWEIMEEDS